jgi:hypothetical protein
MLVMRRNYIKLPGCNNVIARILFKHGKNKKEKENEINFETISSGILLCTRLRNVMGPLGAATLRHKVCSARGSRPRVVDASDVGGYVFADGRGSNDDAYFGGKTGCQKAMGEIPRVARWFPMVAGHVFTCAYFDLGSNGNLRSTRRRPGAV